LNTDPLHLLCPRRKILGISAVLLPFTSASEIDWAGFDRHVERTAAAGLVPAVNMDTGYVNFLDEPIRVKVLERTRDLLGRAEFVAGAFVGDALGSAFDLDAYCREISHIENCGGTPVLFQSFGLTRRADGRQSDGAEVIGRYSEIARRCSKFIGFELGTMFAPFGSIYDLETYGELLKLPACMGAKHSSLSRELEWQRLELRNAQRPDFHVFTGNDLAIDMVMYGSDYLLGLSSFAPDLFARRDAFWEAGDSRFYELNDLLQYLGCFAFRPPVPAYKHSAAMFLHLRGWLESDTPHPRGVHRPDSDREVLRDIAARLSNW